MVLLFICFANCFACFSAFNHEMKIALKTSAKNLMVIAHENSKNGKRFNENAGMLADGKKRNNKGTFYIQ